MQIKLPEKVVYIIKKLNDAGFEAYAVGGCIRDSILGRNPEDFDITTSAKPEEVKEIFDKTIDTGIIHGTVTVLIKQEGFEVTTYRIDGEYEDARHPKDVIFTANLLEDLKRRDFTINAMAYNNETGLIDAFLGVEDLKEKKMKCVGEPQERFCEDALRMLRAVRFAAQLNFGIEENTLKAIYKLVNNLKKISAERIQMELVKLLLSSHPEKMQIIYDTGMSKVFLKEFHELMEKNLLCGKQIIDSLNYIEPQKILRLTMLLHDIENTEQDKKEHGKINAEKAKEILKRLKFDNFTIDKVYKLILWHEDKPLLSPPEIRKAINKIGIEQFPELFMVKEAIIIGSEIENKELELSKINKYKAIYEKILSNNECLDLKDLAVKGKDLIAAGVKPGKEIGEILERLLGLVLMHPEYNQKETLIEKLQEWV